MQTVQNGSGVNYAQLTYTAPGDISTLTMGNSLVESLTWNDRLQPVRIQAGSQLALDLFPCTAQATSCTSGNNGNVRSQKITIPGLTATQLYSYDLVNRLLGASESGGSSSWSEAYGYDDGNGHYTANRYVNPNPAVRTGLPNLTSETPTGPGWFGANNQIGNGSLTDSAGNVQTVGGTGRSFTWDAENRQTSATVGGVTWTYLYDGLGQRVQKTGNDLTTTFVYDVDGNLAAEYQAAGELPPVCATPTCYVTVDHPGSTRMITDNAGNVARRYDYLPFGTELQAGTGGRLASMGYTLLPDGFGLKFTGQVRDQETGLDWFHARMYSAAQGRFTGVDPGNAGADMASPQSWNGYAYVANNPLSFTDPSGESFWSVFAGIFSGLGTFLATGNPVLGAQVGLGVNDTVDSLQNGQFPLAGLLDFAGIAGTGFLGNAIGNANSGPWNEQIPGLGVGSINTGGGFGSGNTSPFVFSAQAGSQPVLDSISDIAAGAGDALTTIPFTSLSLTDWVRKHTPGGDPTNANSGYYRAGQVTGTTLGVALSVFGGATAAAIADGKNGAYFGRGTATVFNSGKVRFGWNWVGPAKGGRDVIRLGIGPARGTAWWSHWNFWFPKAP